MGIGMRSIPARVDRSGRKELHRVKDSLTE
jgi:hypothetical protein